MFSMGSQLQDKFPPTQFQTILKANTYTQSYIDTIMQAMKIIPVCAEVSVCGAISHFLISLLYIIIIACKMDIIWNVIVRKVSINLRNVLLAIPVR